MDFVVGGDALINWGQDSAPVAIGRGGFAVDKREGDGATPIGRFPLRRVLYRPDRVVPPVTALPVAEIAADDGWCDDPADSAYNRPVKLPYPAGHEVMCRDDHIYDLVLVIGHNDNPVISGLGSAVFVHLQRPDATPTAGCVALVEADLRRLLAVARPGDMLVIDPSAALKIYPRVAP